MVFMVPLIAVTNLICCMCIGSKATSDFFRTLQEKPIDTVNPHMTVICCTL